MSEGPILQEKSLVESFNSAGLYIYQPNHTVPIYDDRYKRNMVQLLESYGRIAQKYIQQCESPTQTAMRRHVEWVVRICTDQAIPEDMHLLLNENPIQSTTSILHFIDAKQSATEALQSAIEKSVPMQQAVLVHNVSPNKWVIVFIPLLNEENTDNNRTAEVFLHEGFDRDPVETFLVKLSQTLSTIFPALSFTFNERMQIPDDFKANPVILAYVISATLHVKGHYLSIN